MFNNITVLSLFDGLSCGQIALERAGIKVKQYYASEIDKYAIKITQKNYPQTIQLGDVLQVNGIELLNVDLLIGGSPCNGFSSSGKQLNFDDPRSQLFFEYVRLLEQTHPKYFLFENVIMKKESQDIISEFLGVQPIHINSSLVSAQHRRRLYWTNIPGIEQPEDLGITWKNIREFDVAQNFYYTQTGLDWLNAYGEKIGKKLPVIGNDEKIQTVEANHFRNYSHQRFFAIDDVKGLRYITPLECERAQTIPDNYTKGVSNSQRYKMIGNGWTVDVIAHILKYLK